MAVAQFKDNPYERNLYPIEKKFSQASFYADDVIPALQNILGKALTTRDKDSAALFTGVLRNEIEKTGEFADLFPFEYLSQLGNLATNENLAGETEGYLTYVALHFRDQQAALTEMRNQRIDSLKQALGPEGLTALINSSHNQALAALVTQRDNGVPYTITGDRLVRRTDEIFQEPDSKAGRARLFVPQKMVNEQKTDTLWFNLTIIWIFSALFYLLVLFDAPALFRKSR